ncbi:MAG TPA: hypothetical protein VFV19_04375 [Candidatus Polarisedimenticolaceae bacterium]|nr:hypothetical protein [Candidatus Polarisedimenticolaceae bacterium]
MSIEQAIFGRLILPLAYRATDDRRLRDIPPLLASERWEPERLREAQLSKLRTLLVRADAHVPYYRELFRDLSFDPNETRSGDLGRLPVLTREIIKERLPDLRDESILDVDVVRDATGGSTGTPMEFFHDRRYRALAVASAYRTRMWAGWRPGARMAWIWGAPQETRAWTTPRGRAIGWANRNIYFDAFSAGRREMTAWADRIRRFSPEFVYGYASSIAYFAQHLSDRGDTISGIRGVFSTAERLHGWQRSIIESVLGAKVYDHYGSREVKSIAAQCEAGNLHVLADMNVVDVEEPGTEGSPLVITCLDNHAMPFVRYRIGDVGRLRPGLCSCGRTLPMMDLDIGRETDIFVTPEGRHFHGEYFTHLFYGVSGVARFQFYQPAVEKVILRFVPEPSFDASTRATLESFQERVRKDISPSLALELAAVKDIPLSPTGKFRFTWSDVSVGRPDPTARP